jgi:hypothetical protein
MTTLPSDGNRALAKPEEMAEAIEESGYLIEARVARVLGEHGFFVQRNIFAANPNDATKTIETDVIGRCFEWINEENQSTATASVLVECKNNSQPFAFFVQRSELSKLNDSCIQYGGFPAYSLDPDTKVHVPLHRLLEMKDWHHYCSATEIATQFCSFARDGKKKLKAEPNENYSKSFANLAVTASRDSEGMFGLNLQNIQVQLSYPVVVFQGPIYTVVEDCGKAKVVSGNHIQLHHSALINGMLLTAQIDVVTESEFPKLISTIQTELKTFRDRIDAHYARLLNSALDQKRVSSKNQFRATHPEGSAPQSRFSSAQWSRR